MKLSLVAIPIADWCMPPLGISSIKGFLLGNGMNNIRCYDLNLEFLYYCLDKNKLKECKQQADRFIEKNQNNTSNSQNLFFKECSLNGEYLYYSIEYAIERIKNRETYKNADDYKKYASIIERGLKLFSISCYPTVVSSEVIAFPEGEDDENSIEKYLDDSLHNPLIEFYNLKLPTIIQNDTKYVGISVNYSSQIIPAITLARLIRLYYPNIKIVFGGSLFPAYSSRINDLDIFAKYSDGLIIFAGEYPWLKISEEDHIDNIPGCLYSRGGSYIPNNLTVPKIERCRPDFDDFSLNRYLVPEVVLPYVMSIGCYWGKCQFCGYQSYKDPTIKCAHQNSNLGTIILDDMKFFYDKYQARNFYFVDEAMPALLGTQIADGIQRSKYEFSWYSELRFDSFLDYKYLNNLKQGGCKLILFGLESGNDAVLSRMKKGTNTATIKSILKNCNELGIKTMPMLFFGFPGETREEAKETILFLQDISGMIQYLAMGSFVLLRNIPVYLKASDYGIKIIKRKGELCLYDNYTTAAGLSAKESRKVLNDAYENPYLKRFFDFDLLSRNHLLFLPQELNEIKDLCFKPQVGRVYKLKKHCTIICSLYDLSTGEYVEPGKFYLLNQEQNVFYHLSYKVAEFLVSNPTFTVDDLPAYGELMKIICYFLNEKVVVEQSEQQTNA